MIPLLPEGHHGIMEVKWCMNRLIPFLALDVYADPTPMPQDKEGNNKIRTSFSFTEKRLPLIRVY